MCEANNYAKALVKAAEEIDLSVPNDFRSQEHRRVLLSRRAMESLIIFLSKPEDEQKKFLREIEELSKVEHWAYPGGP